jgi:hypothetical protein
MPSNRFFVYAERLLAYSGALQARLRFEREQADPNAGAVSSPTQRPTARARDVSEKRRGPRDVVERADDGRRIENGVAVEEDGVPSWIRQRVGNVPIEVVPANPEALAFAPAFKGSFSYSQVKNEEVTEA